VVLPLTVRAMTGDDRRQTTIARARLANSGRKFLSNLATKQGLLRSTTFGGEA
jgi:hypothetical protein